jgi:hypothetical protein
LLPFGTLSAPINRSNMRKQIVVRLVEGSVELN